MPNRRPISAATKSQKAAYPSERPKSKKSPPGVVDKAAERKAALAYERELSRRERERAREGTTREKERERRQQAFDRAQAALDKAQHEHANRAAALQAEMENLEKRTQAEDTLWHREKQRLEAALRRALG